MIDLEKIPHIDEISHHGVFSGTHPKKTATFQERCRNRNKVMPSLEEAIRKTGLRDGMTISFHHHFRNGDHILNMVLDQLAAMGFRNLTLAASSLAAVHSPLIGHIRSGLITHIETSGLRGMVGGPLPPPLATCTSMWPSWVRPPVTPMATPTDTAGMGRTALPVALWGMPAQMPNMQIRWW